ncbi:MAG: aspartate--tRNA ligase [Alphaproteobacteria bacterium]|nr:aspartate--tRNA ligase [Alphaproteobacteria bacterium]
MHAYRTHKCNELNKTNVGETIRLSGWIHKIRDHGGVLFIDLRDFYGLTQCVVDEGSELLNIIEKWRSESVVTITGIVTARSSETVNRKMKTGEIEVRIEQAEVQSAADILPFQVSEDDGAGEEIRLKYRYLDLRREKMKKNISLRNSVIRSMREHMYGKGFQEFQTPILTASSPEGARDYLVPSRLHPGKFYALPQAPQQFKQLLMMSGFDKYFQIAPCFRDEDGRADRLAEFYQLDMEMSFVTQEEIFETIQPVIQSVFEEFADFTGEKRKVEWLPDLPFEEAMLRYGTDKPDLRNPLEIVDVSEIFTRDDVEFNAFKNVVKKGGVVRAIRVPSVGEQPRSFFDKLNGWAQGEGAPGLGYVLFEGSGDNPDGKGPISKFIPVEAQVKLCKLSGCEAGDAIFFICNQEKDAAKFAGKARDAICDAIDDPAHPAHREQNAYKFCWVVDFPMYEMNEKGNIDFSHNPFSMPQGGLNALNDKDPLDILANQYDCVCNGFELASGAIRNHSPEIMEKAFSIPGYTKDDLEREFGGMLGAMRYGAPPHGGLAFGVDRIIMLLADEPNLREIYAFVMNGQYEDQMMAAPSDITKEQLKELHLTLNLPKAKL